MTDAIGPATGSVLLAIAAIGILVVTAPFLVTATVDVPAASATGPQVDVPGGEAEDLETDDASHVSANASEGGTTTSGDGPDASDVEIDVDASDTGGYLVPGREVVLTVTLDDTPVEDSPVRVDGDLAGTTDEDGRLAVTVPGSDTVPVEATISDDLTAERTFSAETDLDVQIDGAVSRTNGTVVRATVDGHAVPGADVSVDGEDVNTTTAAGTARVDVPRGAETLDVAASHGDATGSTSLSLDLDVDLATLVPAAGSNAQVSATYGSASHPADVQLYVVDDDVADRADAVVEGTDASVHAERGGASFRLPASSSVTVIATDGHQTTAVALDGLFRNLALGIILTLSVAGGVTLTTMRILSWLDYDVGTGSSRGSSRSHTPGASLAELIAKIGAGILDLLIAVGGVPARVSLPRIPLPSLPALSAPSFSLPTLSLPNLSRPALTFPSLSSLSSVGMPKLTLPSFSLSSLSLSGPETESEAATSAAPTPEQPTDPFAESESPEEPRLSERELVRAAIRDLGRLSGLHRVETRTPGQIGRVAVDRALPREPVEAIVGTVRDAEYAGNEPTRDEATRVKRAVRQLRDVVKNRGEDS